MSRRTLLLVRWGIFLAAFAFLYVRLAAHQSTNALWGEWRGAIAAMHWPVWAALLLLMLLNWGIEAAKWRWLVAHVQCMGIARAFAATLAGTTIGLFTPNRTGEFIGRVLFLEPEHRWQGSFATLLGSIAQFVVTIVMGGIAFIVWWQIKRASALIAPWGAIAGTTLIAVVVAGALVLFYSPHLLREIVARVPLLRRFDRAASVLDGYSTAELSAVLGMSAARYAVFTAQYVLLLVVLAGVPWGFGMLAVPVIYLVMTLVPTMMLTDLGVRGSIAVALLVPANGSSAMVLLAAFLLWAVNLALPAMTGGLILLVARIRARP
ncbi:MAG: lysylphosphatidylglycerol synthase domain-containing protein [Flavobacteriales bacterium]